MSRWVRLLLAALESGLQAGVAEYRRLKKIADTGARQQRDDQDKSDAQFTNDAKKRLEEWQNLTPEERRRRFDAGV